MVDEGHLQSYVATHLASQNFHTKHLFDVLPLGALDVDLVLVDVGEGFIDHRLFIVCAECHILHQPLSLLVILGHDVLILLVVHHSVSLAEEHLVLYDQHIFVDCIAFFVDFLSLDHRQVVQENLAEVMSVFVFKKLDVAFHQCQKVVEIQIECELGTGFVFKSDDS